jgi:hypothetical protein
VVGNIEGVDAAILANEGAAADVKGQIFGKQLLAQANRVDR